MVVVGSLEYDTGEIAGFALDLWAETPVVDLLPDSGSGYSYGSQINENGDILGMDGDPYFFNPGLYGGDAIANAAIRVLLGGGPQDLTEEDTDYLPDEFAGANYLDLNNPLPGIRPAQIVGRSQAGVDFRYTTGATSPETFPEINDRYDLYINDSGVFAGIFWGAKVKGQTPIDPYRYDQAIEPLPLPPRSKWESVEIVRGINSSGDLITNEYAYQDDWDDWVHIDDIVTGTDADLATWVSVSPTLIDMNDRAGSADAAQILARGWGDFSNTFFVLTPEVAEPSE